MVPVFRGTVITAKIMALSPSWRLYIIKPDLNTTWFHVDIIRATTNGAWLTVSTKSKKLQGHRVQKWTLKISQTWHMDIFCSSNHEHFHAWVIVCQQLSLSECLKELELSSTHRPAVFKTLRCNARYCLSVVGTLLFYYFHPIFIIVDSFAVRPQLLKIQKCPLLSVYCIQWS